MKLFFFCYYFQQMMSFASIKFIQSKGKTNIQMDRRDGILSYRKRDREVNQKNKFFLDKNRQTKESIRVSSTIPR